MTKITANDMQTKTHLYMEITLDQIHHDYLTKR